MRVKLEELSATSGWVGVCGGWVGGAVQGNVQWVGGSARWVPDGTLGGGGGGCVPQTPGEQTEGGGGGGGPVTGAWVGRFRQRCTKQVHGWVGWGGQEAGGAASQKVGFWARQGGKREWAVASNAARGRITFVVKSPVGGCPGIVRRRACVGATGDDVGGWVGRRGGALAGGKATQNVLACSPAGA